MQKLLVILFFCAYLTATTELHQLLRLPLLIEHYLQHRAQDASLDFIAFLKLHYSDNAHADSDAQEDRQLPFKSHDSCHGYVTVVGILQPIPVFHCKPVSYTEPVRHRLRPDSFLIASHLATIWQPPKQG